MVPYRNIGELLLEQTARGASRPWLTFYSDRTGRTQHTYGEFTALVSRTANFLLERGVRRGTRIATVAYNHADTVVQYFAAFLIGAVVVPINVGEDDRRIRYILENSDSKIAFVREEFLERFINIASGLKTLQMIVSVADPSGTSHAASGSPSIGEAGALDFHAEIAHHSSSIALTGPPAPDDEALIVYTSGTTGHPKGVVLTQYNLLIDAKAIAEWHGITKEQRMMCVLPIHHVNGTVVTLMTPLYAGGGVVLNQKFHSHKFFERIANERVSVVSVVPTLLQFLLHEDPDLSRCDLSSLRHIICGAGPLTVELALRFEDRFHIPIVHGYGLSETTCYSCFLPLDLSAGERRAWLGDHGFPSIGVPLPTNEMDIHSSDGRAVPEGTKGEIVIRGHNVMKCYYADHEANADAFAHGWFRSGDEGYYKKDSSGRKFFFITGRIKELIIRGGANISPFEIDEVLMNMSGVRAGLAVGFTNDWYGEEVGAYVQAREGAALTERDVIAYCRKYFPFQKCPKVVVFGNDVPVTSTGKYQRNRLKPLFERWRGVQFKDDA